MKKFTIKGDRTTGYETMVDGVDVSSTLNGLQLRLGDGGPPELVLSVNTGRIEVEAEATITVIDPGAELRAILEFLDSVNSAVLEEQMLGGDMGSGPAEMAIRSLKDAARQNYADQS
jgi:hypothetical protein